MTSEDKRLFDMLVSCGFTEAEAQREVDNPEACMAEAQALADSEIAEAEAVDWSAESGPWQNDPLWQLLETCD